MTELKKRDQNSTTNLGDKSPNSQRSEGSPNNLKREDVAAAESTVKSLINIILNNPKKSASGGLILVALVAFTFYPNQTWININFTFPVYCPLNKLNYEKLLGNTTSVQVWKYATPNGGDQNRRMLTTEEWITENQTIPTYVIYVKVRQDQTSKAYTMTYCSAVVDYQNKKNCNDPKFFQYGCSSPGPMFHVEQNQEINVIWINDISTEDSLKLSNQPDYYHFPGNKMPHFQVENKTFRDVQKNCTFTDPTEPMKNGQSRYQLSSSQVPISTHIHGLEVRPNFDGNPLSWWTQSGQKGIGFMSLNINDDYFNNRHLFPSEPNNYTSTILFTNSSNVKINNYPNKQAPGNLWYHDHAMRATQYNVLQGLAGMYIIYNQEVEDFLSLYTKEILVVGNTNLPKWKGNPSSQKLQLSFIENTVGYNRKQLYRFRLLNGNFGDTMTVKIHYKNKPTDVNSIPLNVTVIGTDSVLFDTFVSNVPSNFVIGEAERIQIVVDFSQIPQNVTEASLDVSYGKAKFNLKLKLIGDRCTTRSSWSKNSQNDCLALPSAMMNCSGQKNNSARCVTLFQDLNVVAPADYQRFRPLDVIGGKFSISGHTDFMHAQTENPKIGTTEDWTFINFLWFGHPIHVHLIQYQVQARYKLKMFNSGTPGCSYYKLDFYKNLVINQTKPYINYTNEALCKQINSKISGFGNAKPEIIDSLNQNYLENQFTANQLISDKDLVKKEGKTYMNISGQYLYRLNKPGENYLDKNCDDSYANYSYICNNAQVADWEKRWKETTFVEPDSATRVRIRWASPEYNSSLPEWRDNYFRLSEESIVEYPGYVYHCHILDHEDNEMMRPIMMQFSDKHINGDSVTSGSKNWTGLLQKNSDFKC